MIEKGNGFFKGTSHLSGRGPTALEIGFPEYRVCTCSVGAAKRALRDAIKTKLFARDAKRSC